MIASSATPPTPQGGQEVAAPGPSGSALAQFARLVRWELFLAWRRRALLLTLGILLLVGYALVTLVEVTLYFAADSNNESYARHLFGATLGLPGVFAVGAPYITSAGLLAFVMLAGALIGSDYSYSTLRLAFTRGTRRGALLAAQVCALALLALALAAALLLVVGLAGAIGQASGVNQAAFTPTAMTALHGALLWLALALNLLAYALVALWVGTISRSVVGAIAGPLGFVVIEVVVSNVLGAFTETSQSDPTATFLSHIPDYLLGPNLSAIIGYARGAPPSAQINAQPLSLAHALVLVGAYCAFFILTSFFILQGRDVLE